MRNHYRRVLNMGVLLLFSFGLWFWLCGLTTSAEGLAQNPTEPAPTRDQPPPDRPEPPPSRPTPLPPTSTPPPTGTPTPILPTSTPGGGGGSAVLPTATPTPSSSVVLPETGASLDIGRYGWLGLAALGWGAGYLAIRYRRMSAKQPAKETDETSVSIR